MCYLQTLTSLFLHVFTVYAQDSWRKKLRMKFKNLCRPKRAQKAGITVNPRSKKLKSTTDCSSKSVSCIPIQSVSGGQSDVAQYEKHVAFLQKSYASKKWVLSTMLTILDETAVIRRKWIEEDHPSVSQVLLKFPCFEDSRIVSICILYTCYIVSFIFICMLLF